MDKTKRLIISLSIALVILLVLNFVINTSFNSNFIEIPVFSKDMLKGSKINEDYITLVKVKITNNTKSLYDNALTSNDILGKVLSDDVYSGEIVTANKIILAEEKLQEIENYEYISIPVGTSSYATANKLKRGDKVIIYFTAKNKEVEKAIGNTNKIYSSTNSETLVTSRLLENVEVISTHNNAGNTSSADGIVTDVLVRLEAEQAMIVANLKSQGTFDIVLKN